MSDSLSSYHDTRLDLQTLSEKLLTLSGQVAACAGKLKTKHYAVQSAEQVLPTLQAVKQCLTGCECGWVFVSDLLLASEWVATRTDHRGVEVVRYGLQKLASYLVDLAEDGVESSLSLMTAFNELSGLQKKSLITENLFSVPDEYRIDVDTLQLIRHSSSGNAVRAQYLAFSQTMLGVYRGEDRERKLQQLAGFFLQLSEEAKDHKARDFWLLCNTFVSTVENPKGELSPARFSVFKQIESVLHYALDDVVSPVLGVQQKLDHLLVNLLCYTHADAPLQGLSDNTLHFVGVQAELTRLHHSLPEHGEASLWVKASMQVLYDRLQYCTAILSEEALGSEDSVGELQEELFLLKRVLVLIGVHGARENITEAEEALREVLTSQVMQSCFTSVQRVEHQMLERFGFLIGASEPVTTDSVLENQTEFKPTAETGTETETETETETGQLGVSQSSRGVARTEETVLPGAIELDQLPVNFGARCNLCIDVIQQSLDTALGSSGNLVPDSSVIGALCSLIDLVTAEGVDALAHLLVPLSQMLTTAKDSTLNQSDTLLVQEAIIAATLGIDSLVGEKPMPDLVADVSQRVEEVLQATSQRLGSGLYSNSSRSSFLAEARELLPRLFELFQRLRGAPHGASRLHSDINRLLHAFIVSAEEAQELSLAELAHSLESAMVDLTQSNAVATRSFFDLAIESIECLDEDIERLHNGQEVVDRSDLIDLLKLECVVENTSSREDQSFDAIDQQAPGFSADDQHSAVRMSTVSNESTLAKVTGVVRVGRSVEVSASSDLLERLRRLESSCNAIGSSHKQLLDLQLRTEQALQSAIGSGNNPLTASEKALQSLANQLQQITENQSVSVKMLNQELSNAATVNAASLGRVLEEVLGLAADKQNMRVKFAFESSTILLHRNLYEQLALVTSNLLRDIMAFTVADRESSELPMLTVNISQDESTTFIEVSDNGCGVTVEGVVARSENPWAQVARPDWREVVDQSGNMLPRVRSRQSDKVVPISGLLEFASRYGGTVAIKSDNAITAYRLCLPLLDKIHDVLVVALGNYLIAVPVACVDCVGFTEDVSVPSLGALIGMKTPPTSVNQLDAVQSVTCKTRSGLQQFSVSQVIGHKRLSFSASHRVLPDMPGYMGVSSTDANQPVMLLDVDYWIAQVR